MWFLACITIIIPQLKLTDAPANNTVLTPTAPALCTVNEIILIEPLAVGNDGAAPDGNLKYVESRVTVAIPEF